MNATAIDKTAAPARRARFAFDFHIGDPEADPPLGGYTDGRTWNGFAIPLLPVGEVLRMFLMVVDAGTAREIDANTVRITDADGSYDLTATEITTEDGPRWLVDCNLAMTFHNVTPDAEVAS